MDNEKLDQLNESLTKLINHFTDASGAVESATKKLSKNVNNINVDKIIQNFDRSIKRTSYEMQQLDSALQALDEAANSATTTQEQAAIQAKKSILLEEKERRSKEENIAQAEKVREAYVSFANSLTSNTITKSLGELTKSLQSNASSTEFSSAALNAAIDGIGGSLKSVSTSVANAGSNIKGFWGGLATAAGVFGVALADTGTKAAKFANEVLSAEILKTVNAFNSASTAGAIFADGMTGLRNAAVGSGLTIEQFSNVIKNNSTLLAESGIGIAEGAKQVGRVGEIFRANGGKIQKEMLRLGFSFEEQAELTATVIANMRRGVGGKFDDRQIAEETRKYAENLRLLSSLTGEDAKAKAEKVKQENTELAFQLELANMSEKQRNDINLAMAAMTEAERKNFKDRMVHGVVVNKEGAIMEAMSQQARKSGEHLFDLYKQGNFTAEAVLKERHATANATLEESKQFKDIAAAAYRGVEGVAGASDGLRDRIAQAVNLKDVGSIDEVAAKLRQTAEGGDKMTDSVVDAASAHQALAVKIQDILIPAMEKYAELTSEITQGLEQMLKSLGFETPAEKERKEAEQKRKEELAAKMKDPEYMKQHRVWKEEKFGAEKDKLGWFDRIAEKRDMMFNKDKYSIDQYEKDQALKKSLQLSTDRELARAASTKPKNEPEPPKFAVGGIAAGPKSGFDAILHGTEAVVPLPDGKNIPVHIQFGQVLPKFIETLNAQQSSFESIIGATKSKSPILPDQLVANLPQLTQSTQQESNEIYSTLVKERIGSSAGGLVDTHSKISAALLNSLKEMPKTLETSEANNREKSNSLFSKLSDFMSKITSPEKLPGPTSQLVQKPEVTTSAEIAKEQIELMRQFIRKADDLIAIAAEHKDISTSLLQNSY